MEKGIGGVRRLYDGEVIFAEELIALPVRSHVAGLDLERRPVEPVKAETFR